MEWVGGLINQTHFRFFIFSQLKSHFIKMLFVIVLLLQEQNDE